MPRKTHSSSPDHVRTSASLSTSTDKTADAPKAHHFPADPPTRPSTGLCTADVAPLLVRDDGWLRVVPDEDGKAVWWKWKFTRGPWAGFYVMCLGRVDQHPESIAVLLHKLGNVDAGKDKPIRDRFYDQT